MSPVSVFVESCRFPGVPRWSWVAVALAMVASSGCAAPDGKTRSPAAPEVTESVNAERALWHLADIEPLPQVQPSPEPMPPLSARVEAQIAKAHAFIAEQRFTQASMALEKALRYDADHPVIHRTLATLHLEAGNVERARRHAEQVIAVRPDDGVAHYVLGRCHALRDERSKAIESLRVALICPDIAEHPVTIALCHYYLAEQLRLEGYLTAALEAYDAFDACTVRLVNGDADESAREKLQAKQGVVALTRSMILESLGRFADAAASLKPLLSGGNADGEQLQRSARLWLRAGRFDEAIAAARSVSSNDDKTLSLLLDICRQAGKREIAVEELTARLKRNPQSTRIVLFLADALDELGRQDDALATLTTFVADHPESDTARMRLVEQLMSAGRHDDAVRRCAEAIQARPAMARDFALRFVEVARRHDALEPALKLAPAPAFAGAAESYLLAEVSVATERPAQAEALLKRAYQANPTLVASRVALAQQYLDDYRYDEALEVAQRSDPTVAEDAALEAVLGRIYERLDDLAQAELHLKSAIQLNRDDAESMLLLAEVLHRTGDSKRARLQLRVLLDRFPDHDTGRERLGLLYMAEGKLEAAFDVFSILANKATNSAIKARCEALLALRKSSDVSAYRAALQAAITEHDPNAITLLALADTFTDESGFDKARSAYRQALALDPDNEDAVLRLVRIEQRLLDFESAADRLEALLPRRPNRHEWRLRLIDLDGYVLRHDKALALAEAQLDREDLSDEIRRSYRVRAARTLRAMGREAEVLTQLESWSQANPDDDAAAVRLAQEYLAQDRGAEAIGIYEQLYEKEPGNKAMPMLLVAALMQTGLHDRAAQYVLDQLDDDPENDETLSRLAEVLADGGRHGDALDLIHSRLWRTRRREVFQDFTSILLRASEQFGEAIAHIERLIEQVEVSGEDLQRPRDQRRDAAEGLVDRPNEPATAESLRTRLVALRFNLAATLIEAERYDEARGKLTDWLEFVDDPGLEVRLLGLLAACYQRAGQGEEATAASKRALAINPMNPGLNNDVAYGWIDQGIRLEQAEKMIRRSVARRPDQAAYLDTYGWLLYKKGDFEGAEKWLMRAIAAQSAVADQSEGDPVLFDHLGDALWRLGKRDEAIDRWMDAVSAIKKRAAADGGLLSDDERRVERETKSKVEAAQGGQPPKTADLKRKDEPDPSG